MGCMSLALVIVYSMQTKHVWNKYLIICHSSLLGSMMISGLILLGKVFLSGMTLFVLNTVLSIINLSDIAFLIVFIPYFITWLIASPWRAPYKQLFIVLAIIYFILGVVRFFYELPILESIRSFIFVFVLAFCFVVMLKNLSSIALKRVRNMAISVIIASVALLPFLGTGLINEGFRFLVEGLYFLFWSIILLVFFFNYFKNVSNVKEEKKELSIDDLEKYHITKREFSVIELISQGKTNKEIAVELDISVNTVNNHVANIFTKAEVRSRIDLLNLIRDIW
jgi:DNA-binding CsgD family transcriptional regulator